MEGLGLVESPKGGGRYTWSIQRWPTSTYYRANQSSQAHHATPREPQGDPQEPEQGEGGGGGGGEELGGGGGEEGGGPAQQRRGGGGGGLTLSARRRLAEAGE